MRILIRPIVTRLLVEKTEIGEKGFGVGTKEDAGDSLFRWFALFRVIIRSDLTKFLDLYDHAPCGWGNAWLMSRSL